MRLKWDDLSQCLSFAEKVQRAGLVLVYRVNVAGYRPSWRKEKICVRFRIYVLKEQAYKLWKIGREFRNKIDKLMATAAHNFPFEPWRRHQCTTLGKAKIIQRSFPLYNAKSRMNRILRLALNVVQYYSVRLKVIENVAAATTIAASEERKQW